MHRKAVSTEENAMRERRTIYFILFCFSKSSLSLSSSTRRRFYPLPSSGQAVVTGVVPSLLRYVPSIFIRAKRVSNCYIQEKKNVRLCGCSTNLGFSVENTNLGFSVWYVLCASYVCTWYQVSAGRNLS